VVITLQPADEIPNLLGGAAGPMMFLRAAIGGAPLSAGQGEKVPLTYAMVARPRRRASADPPAPLGRPAPAPVAPSWAVLAPRSARCMSPSGSGPSWPAHRSRSPVRANAVRTVVSARDPPTRGRWCVEVGAAQVFLADDRNRGGVVELAAFGRRWRPPRRCARSRIRRTRRPARQPAASATATLPPAVTESVE
jgi:hypothetical protein